MAVPANKRCDWGSISESDGSLDLICTEATFGENAWDLKYQDVFREAAQDQIKAAIECLTIRFNLAEAWAQHYLREALDSVQLQTPNSNNPK